VPERKYQLKVIVNGLPVKMTWVGKDGPDAVKRYQDMYPDHTVVAWREIPFGLFIMGDARNIVER